MSLNIIIMELLNNKYIWVLFMLELLNKMYNWIENTTINELIDTKYYIILAISTI